MTIHFLQNIFEKSINGEWGNEDSGNGEATAVIRTSNFLNSGRLNLDNIVCRDIDKNKNSDKILRTGDIIIEKSGGSPNQPVGRVVYFDVTDQDYFTNNFTSILRVKSGYNSKYIFYLMKYLYDTKKVLKFQNQTTGIINLKLTDYLNKTKVNIETIENQNTIVDILDRLEYQIINRNKQLSELSNLVKSRFNELFGDIFDNPQSKLEDHIELNPNKKELLNFNGNVSFLPMSNVSENGKIDLSINRNIDDVRKGFTFFKDNDVIVAKITPCFENGKGAPVFGLLNGVGFGSTEFHVLRPKNTVNTVWLYHVTMLSKFRVEGERKMTGSGGQRRITKDFINNFKLNIPPLALQNEFAEFVAQVDKSQLAIQKSLEELETLKKSLMQEYFG